MTSESPRNHPFILTIVLALMSGGPTWGRPPQNTEGEFSCDGDSIWVRTTAYCHRESDHVSFGRKSAKGTRLRYGKIRSAAADWSRFPLGTRFKIQGQPYEYHVDDYGIALTDSWTIDLYFPTMSMMHRWGTKRVKIEVLEWGSFEKSLKILKGRSSKGAYIRRMIASLEQDSGLVPESDPDDDKIAESKSPAANKKLEGEAAEKPSEDT